MNKNIAGDYRLRILSNRSRFHQITLFHYIFHKPTGILLGDFLDCTLQNALSRCHVCFLSLLLVMFVSKNQLANSCSNLHGQCDYVLKCARKCFGIGDSIHLSRHIESILWRRISFRGLKFKGHRIDFIESLISTSLFQRSENRKARFKLKTSVHGSIVNTVYGT